MASAAVRSTMNDELLSPVGDSADEFAQAAASERGRLLAMARRSLSDDEAEDLVQEVLLAGLEQRERFEGRSRVSTWLVAILLRKIVDRHRRLGRDRKRLVPGEAVVERLEAGARFDAERRVLVDESLEAARRAMMTLSDRERTVIEAFATLDNPGEALQDSLGVTGSHLRVIVSRTRARVRELAA